MNPEPGQFYMLQVGLHNDPLLKRPFCMFDSDAHELAILVKRVGRGTAILTGKLPGSFVDVLGPLGTPYPRVEKEPLIISGGMGMASVYSLIKRYGKDCRVIYGAGSREGLISLDNIREMAGEVAVTTDDGSEGTRGNVMDKIGEYADKGSVVYACGPEIMLMKVSRYCVENGIECYVSLEQNMACGIGSCVGCVVKTLEGYKRVCKEGPVFRADEIVWD